MKMFISKKNHLRDIKRVRIPENRDLKDGLRLNRNERVENWGSEFIKKILAFFIYKKVVSRNS